MSDPLKTIPEILGALRETAKIFDDEHNKNSVSLMYADCSFGSARAYSCATEQVEEVIARIESGQSEQAAHKEAAYEEAWDRMIKALTGMRVAQIVTKVNALDAGDRDLVISLNGTVIAIESMLEEMQAIQARIEAGE